MESVQYGSNPEDMFLHTMALIMIAVAVIFATVLASTPAPYGAFSPESSQWGPRINPRLAWILQESPSFLVPLAILFFGEDATVPLQGSWKAKVDWKAKLLAACFLTHYFHRSFLYPFAVNMTKKSPVVVAFMAFAFTCFNGVQQVALWLQRAHWDSVDASTYMLGLLVWLTGACINIHSDYYLMHLKKEALKAGQVYQLPNGGFFKYVSGAQYFGEIVEWLGYAIASQHIAAWAFAWFTICNVAPRAFHYHGMYQERFYHGFPQNRKVLVPGIL